MASPSVSTCPVCLKELRRGVRGELGKPENCDHLFCFTCIHEWAKNVNNCPVDRIPFNHIEVLSSRNRKLIKKVYVADHSLTQVLEDPDDVTYCEICHEGNRENSLLLCDGCDRGYHLECLSPPLDDIPEGDWYCSQCELIVRSQHAVVFSSDEEYSPFVTSEDINSISTVSSNSNWSSWCDHSFTSSTDDELQHRRRTRSAPHLTLLETDSEEENSDSSLSDIVRPRRVHTLRRLGVNSSESFNSGEDDEAESNSGLESDHEQDFSPGDRSEQDSEGSSVMAGSTLRKRRVLDSESDEDEGNVVVRQPSAKKHRSSRYVSKGKRRISQANLLPDSDLETSEEEPSASPDFHLHDTNARSRSGRDTNRGGKGKGKEPASSSKQAKKKALSLEAPQPKISLSSDSDNLSLHSGYCSPYQSTFTSMESCESSWAPSKRLKAAPIGSPRVTRQCGIQNATTRRSERKIRIDDVPAERRLLTSAKPAVLHEALPDDFEEKVLGGGRTNTKKVTNRKQSRKREIRRRNVKSARGSSALRNRSAMSNHAMRSRSTLRTRSRSVKKKRTKRATKRKVKAGTVSDADPAISDFTPRGRECAQTRSRARTAATHSPRDPTFRAAVIAAYRHENTTTGLQQAQALLQQRRESLQNTSLRHSTAAATYGPRFHTPSSGYNTPYGQESSKNEQQDSLGRTLMSSTPLSSVRQPAGGGIRYGNDEVTRRMIPRRQLSYFTLSVPSVHRQLSSVQEDGGSVSRTTFTREPSSGDLLGTICQSLNDLQQKSNVIRRDGSIIPINIESSSDCELTPTRETSPLHRHGNSKGNVTSESKGGHSKALPKSWESDIYNNVPPKTSSGHNDTAGTRRHTQAIRLESHSQNHDHGHAHNDLHIKSAFSNDVKQDHTRQGNARHSDQSNPSGNAHTQAKTLVKEIVKGYYKAGTITNREYWRILEKATEKVQSGRQPVNEGRVRRLIADYVEGYKHSRRTLAL